MYRDIYAFEVADKMKSGMVVCCTDRLKGDTFYMNGLTASEFFMFMKDAEADQTNRFQFYTYEKKEDEQDA
jgi:hypothetical protein